MFFLKRLTTFFLLPLLVTFVFFYCNTLPANPADPANTAISAIIKTTDGKMYKNSLADTVNKKFLIGAALGLPENFDSLRLSITFKNDTVFDTMLLIAGEAMSYFDTIWTEQTLFSPGIYYATFTPFTNLTSNLSPATIDILMVEAEVMPENHKPSISVSGNTIFTPGDTCVLSITKTDPDTMQVLTTATKGKPEGSLLKDNKFTWIIPSGFTGIDTISFIVSDNGYPQESDTEIVVITVTSTPHVPLITISGDSIVKPFETCILTLHTSDKDSGQILTVTMAGQPAGAALENDSQFTWTAPDVSSAKYIVTFTVTDNGIPPLSSSVSVAIKVESDTGLQNQTHTVTYNGNGSTSGSVPIDTNHYLNGTSVTVAAAGTLVKTGATFAGWNTNADGTGTTRAAGSSYAIGAVNDTLYAQWTTNPTFTVTYIGNGSTSGSVPNDANRYISGASVTVAAAGTLVKTGATFAGWNTNADGTGTTRAAGSSYAIGAANDTLYAQWTTNPTFTVTYNTNTGSGDVPVDTNKYEEGALVIVQSSSTLVKMGYTFNGWNTAADGSGTMRAATTSFNMPSVNVTLYAQWKLKQYHVTYDANGASTGNVPTDATAHDSASSVTVMANTGNLIKAGFIFDGWNTSADGKGTAYSTGTGTFVITANTTLFATWKIKTFTLNYNGNENNGGDVPDAAVYDSIALVTVSGNTNGLTKKGFDFNGWNSSANGSGVVMAVGSTFKIKSDTTLYAQWIVKKYRLTIDPPVNGTINLSGDVNVDSNTTTTITASASAGFKFKCWRITSGSAIIADTTAASTTVTLTQGDASIMAVFGCLTFAKQLTIQGYDNLNIVDAIQSEDGGYLAIASNGLLIKLNATGEVVWTKAISFTNPSSIEKANNSYIITGPDSGNSDGITIVSVSQSGNQSWSVQILNDSNNTSRGVLTRATADNGYITCGTNNYDFCLIKSTYNGTVHVQWNLNYNGDRVDEMYDVQQTSDGGFIFAGGADMNTDLCVIKTSSDGEIEWTKFYSDELSKYYVTNANSINPTPDGDVIIGGYGSTYGGGYILKISESTGVVKMFHEYSNTTDINAALPVKDGYILAGTTNSFGIGDNDIYVAKINSTGTIMFETSFGSITGEGALSTKPTKDGGCIITGTNNWLIKTDENGKVD